ncbi:RNA polymerase subunit sigma [Xaviernesmea oryzae]|uniref:RNA polymerase subunit sigma n=1 Tax=Xaviernesmea oryzae TaxID=464029 RepID=A0A1Q9AUY1_9HYPH|nr:sigma-70 family RNA polymerase sigma factor [Xaviernesmea oryzae]OLP59267.1 RNA polymerase subunit sigma [Xaviernesmea oryzae]SEK78710.1 RNA polymerase sigma-70 factor, ECF subfamily [Xaviernesmea oryzae]
MNDEDLALLISRVGLKDRDAFSRLYRASSPKLFGVCLRMLKDRAEAEEALQEVYVKIWARADGFVPAATSAAGWLQAIARNQAIDRLRARKPVADVLDEAYDLPDSTADPEACAVAAGERRRIDACLDELAPDRADAVRRAYIEGASYQELADHFAVPLNTMRTWLRRSLLTLRECLER